MDLFYATVTALCFTLLGLWWAVVELRHREWARDPAKRRVANSIFLALLVPGIMSLGAQIAPEIRIVWQSVFILGSLGGAIATLMLLRAMRGDKTQSRLAWAGRGLMLGLYLFVFLTALAPQIYASVGLTGLQGEAIWTTLLVLLGVILAWDALTGPEAIDQPQ